MVKAILCLKYICWYFRKKIVNQINFWGFRIVNMGQLEGDLFLILKINISLGWIIRAVF